MYTLKNNFIEICLDDKARVVSLINLKKSKENIIVKPCDESFFINCKNCEDWEDHIISSDQQFEVTQDKNSINYHSEKIYALSGLKNISLTLSINLADEEVVFDANINNNEKDIVITDFEYPKVGVIKTIGDNEPSLLFPIQNGLRYDKVGSYLSSLPESRENRSNCIRTGYPGNNGSMHWMALETKTETLFLQCRDNLHHSSEMRADGSREDKGAITLVFNILPFVKHAESWDAPSTHMMLYIGSWHKGADSYREWAKTFAYDHYVPKWTDEMLGYFLVINKQQFGHEMWPYDTLPKLYDMAIEHGCDTLGLFGWYHSGHDNQYPDLEVSPTLGGKDNFKENIKKVQEKGGRVTLYQQGHLIDPTTEYYKNGGHNYQLINRSGLPYYEYYNKSHKSEFLRTYTSKYFALSCPSCPQWRELMVEKVDFAKQFEPDGVLFDQIGGMYAYPCFSDEHPHEKGKESLALTNGRKQLLEDMQQRSKKTDSEFAFLSEHITDVYAGYLDCLHGIMALPSAEGKYMGDRSVPYKVNEPSLFKYCFPKRRCTIRNPFPYIDYRTVNYAFTFGFVYEMEIRYQQDCEDILADKWPEYRCYAKSVTQLRKKYINELIKGDFCDDIYIAEVTDGIIAKCFVSNKNLAVTLWNDSSETKKLTLKITLGTMREYSTTKETQNRIPDKIPAGSIAVVIYDI